MSFIKNLTTLEISILDKTLNIIDSRNNITLGRELTPLLNGFRGKNGYASFAISPNTSTQLYKLIKLYNDINIGYLIQGANTALKGQGTPNGSPEKPVVIIRTTKLKQYKILDYPGTNDFKIMLVQPGLSLKEAEVILNQIGFDLPHKIGSHDLGNTFGASCANGCGGVRVDNRDGRATMTKNGNMGVIAISANGLIYNGFIRRKNLSSGAKLLEIIDHNSIEIDDIELPDINEIDIFLNQLFIDKSYPIRNHRGEIIFAGDGGEGLQVIAYQMYLVRKKPLTIKTYGILFTQITHKEVFYKKVVFALAKDNINCLPILCESMNDNLVAAIVKNGVGYLNAFLLVIAPNFTAKHIVKLLKVRTNLIKLFPYLYISLESFIGKVLSTIFTPKCIKTLNFKEMLFVQMANRNTLDGNIQKFEESLETFIDQYPSSTMKLLVNPSSFQERILLQIRNVAAITTLSLSQQHKGELLAFDDAIMPGAMVNEYTNLFFKQLAKKFPDAVQAPYLYGHDLKQINHNDWVIKRRLTMKELEELHHLQRQTLKSLGGTPHAEHGVGDYADRDLDRDELIKLVAHRLLNDPSGIANPGGGPEKAFRKALLDTTIVADGINFAKMALKRESNRDTLMTWDEKLAANLSEKLDANIQTALSYIQNH